MAVEPLTDAELDDVMPGTPTLTEHIGNVGLVQTVQARAMLDLDTKSLPTWFSRQLHTLLGPIPPLDITVVAARPGCGKTSLMLAQARHMVASGQKVVYVGTEMPGWRLRIQIAAQECQLSTKLVIQGRWAELPVGSKERILERVDAFDRDTEGRWFFVPEDAVDHLRLMDYVAQAGDTGATLFVDYLQAISWGARGAGRTESLTTGMERLRDYAKEKEVRCFLAAQLRRSGTYDALADYMVPDQSAIKESGAIEEVAHTIILLHRALKPTVTEMDIALVRRGQKKITEVVEHGTSVAVVGKDRLGGLRDEEARLYVENGELFDSSEARQLVYGVGWTPR